MKSTGSELVAAGLADAGSVNNRWPALVLCTEAAVPCSAARLRNDNIVAAAVSTPAPAPVWGSWSANMVGRVKETS